MPMSYPKTIGAIINETIDTMIIPIKFSAIPPFTISGILIYPDP